MTRGSNDSLARPPARGAAAGAARTPTLGRVAGALKTAAALALLALGMYWCGRQWRFERALAAGDPAAATRAWPEADAGWRARSAAQLAEDPPAAAADARRARALATADWRNWRALARAEAELGDWEAARAATRRMVADNDGFAAVWSEASLELLRGDEAGFWATAARALAVAPAAEREECLRYCANLAARDTAGPGPLDAAVRRGESLARGCAGAAGLRNDYLNLLLTEPLNGSAGRWNGAARPAPGCGGDAEPNVVDLERRRLTQWLEAGRGAEAYAAWSAWRRHWAGAKSGELLNFAPSRGDGGGGADDDGLDPRPGWQICPDCGPYALITNGSLELQFRGVEDGDAGAGAGDSSPAQRPAWRWLLAAPGREYEVSFEARAEGVNGTGVEAVIGEAREASAAAVATSPGTAMTLAAAQAALPAAQAPLGDNWASARLRFRAAAEGAAYRLEIIYRRPSGQLPLTGRVWLRNFRWREIPGGGA